MGGSCHLLRQGVLSPIEGVGGYGIPFRTMGAQGPPLEIFGDFRPQE